MFRVIPVNADRPQGSRPRLLVGASLSVLAVMIGAGRADAQGMAAMRQGGALTAPVATAPSPSSQASSPIVSPEAQSAALRALRNQTAAAQTSDLAAQAQAAAHAAAAALSNVPNGLRIGGLQPVRAPVASTADTASGLNTWQGAGAPVQTVTGSTTEVRITQTDPHAVLSWESFNVGRDTSLVFDQKLNGQAQPEWVVLNRVVGQIDPTTGLRNGAAAPAPSQILGSIKADGTVLVLNPNGVLFGANSSIDTHSFAATSLEIGRGLADNAPISLKQRNDEFLSFGLLGVRDQISPDAPGVPFTFSAISTNSGGGLDPLLEGDITVSAGARLTAKDGGFLLLTGPRIVNGGTLTADRGQVSLQSGRQVLLQRSEGAADSLDPDVRGFVVSAEARGSGDYVRNLPNAIVQADEGYISLQSTTSGAVSQEGILRSSTSVSRNGLIRVDGGDIAIGAGSLTTVIPQSAGETIPQGAESVAAFKPSKVEIGNVGSRIEIRGSSLIYAPSAEITIGARPGPTTLGSSFAPNSRLFIDDGAVIDASGLKDVLVPASRSLITIRPVKRNELRDAPDYRNGFLNGATVTVDPRLSGVRPDGVAWVGSPLIEAESYYDQVGIDVSELMTTGGQVTLGVAGYDRLGNAAAPDIIVKPGASIDISGGWRRFEAGPVATTKLISASGAIVDISQADPGGAYVGIANGFTMDYPRWGVSETFFDPLTRNTRYEDAYIEGRDAGALTLKGSAIAFDGAVYGQAYAGSRQVMNSVVGTAASSVYGDDRALQAAPSQLPSGALLAIQALATSNGAFIGGGDISIQAQVAPLAASLRFGQSISFAGGGSLIQPSRDPASLLGTARRDTIQFSANALSAMGLGQLNLATSGHVDVAPDARLALAPGGIFNAQAGRAITVRGSVAAPGGKISLITDDYDFGSVFRSNPSLADFDARSAGDFDIVVTGGLSVRGLWTNDLGATPEQRRGRAYIDGGAIVLDAAPRVALLPEVVNPTATPLITTNTDISGSILLQSGATVDLSAGGYVAPLGALDLTASGGDLSLIEETTWFGLADDTAHKRGGLPGLRVTGIGVADISGPVLAVNPSEVTARVFIGQDVVRAQGFGQGGAFSLTTPQFSFGSPTSGAGTSLPLDFLSRAGFGGYNITSYKTDLSANRFSNGLGGFNAVLATQSVTVGAGQTLNLVQSAYSPLVDAAQTDALRRLGSGQDLRSILTPAIPIDAWDQRGVNLALGGLMELHVAAGGRVEGARGSGLTVGGLFNEGTIRLPGGNVSQSLVLPQIYAGSTAIAVRSLDEAFSTGPGGTISEGDANRLGIRRDTLSPVLTNAELAAGRPLYLLADLNRDEGVRLSSTSTLDLSGGVILNPRAAVGSAPVRDGVVTAGGSLSTASALRLDSSVTLFGHTEIGAYSTTGANPSGTRVARDLVAASGSRIDVSGAAATFDRLDASGHTAASLVWSNGGALSLGGGAIVTGAVIRADGGAAQALGGTLSVLDPVLTQNDPSSPIRNLFSASAITAAGFDTLVAKGSLSSRGDVSLSLGRGFFLTSRPNDGASDFSAPLVRDRYAPLIHAQGALSISAPYVGLVSDVQTISAPLVGGSATGSLTLSGNVLDVRGAVLFDQSLATARLTFTGDVRLTGARPYQQVFGLPQLVDNSLIGGMVANGDLTITAAQVYPTTGSTFAITSASPTGVIRFAQAAGAAPNLPYSAGGALTVQAASIIQGGTLRAPLGALTLGSAQALPLSTEDPTGPALAPATTNLTLASGSISSVSAGGLSIPYGTTTDQIEWFFSPTRGDRLTAAPRGVLKLGARYVALQSGATVDISGGGDVYAYEFVSGAGGSRDVLDRFNGDAFSANDGLQYPDGRQVYAIVPGLSDSLGAAFDPAYSADYADLYAAQNAGLKVHLDAAPGLAAGDYTLLPAKYALLPGGMRIVEYPGGSPAAGASARLADGTIAVTGRYGLGASLEATPRAFEVLPQEVIRKSSNIALTFGDAYFKALALRDGVTAAPLPIDAGRLVVESAQSLVMNAQLKTGAAEGGRRGQVDLAGSAFVIGGADAAPTPGAISLSADALTALGAGSLLIGGVRTDQADGTTSLRVTASAITLANDAKHPLSGPEVLLSTDGPNSSLTIASGSAIVATGAGADGQAADYVIDGAGATMTGQGSFIRVAQGGLRDLTRLNPEGSPSGVSMNIGSALLSGNALTMSSSGAFRLTNSQLVADQIALAAPRINFAALPATGTTLSITPDLLPALAKAGQVTLHGSTSIGFETGTYGFKDLRVDTPLLRTGGADARLNAVNLTFGNSGKAAAACTPTCLTGSLTVVAETISFGSGAVEVFGAANGASLTAKQGVFVAGQNALFDTGSGDLTINSPFIGDRAARPDLAPNERDTSLSLTLQTAGALKVNNPGATTAAIATGTPGTSLSLQGQSVAIAGTRVRATAGTLTILATKDLSVTGAAILETPSYARLFGDSADQVQVSAPGGLVHLTSLTGNVSLATQSKIAIGGPSGQAGALWVSAAAGEVQLNGALDPAAPEGSASIRLDTGGAIDLSAFAQGAGRGFTGAWDIRSGRSDLVLKAGDTVRAQTVSLTADGGAVMIGGRIDTSGIEGGDVSLFGAQGVRLATTGVIDTRASGYADSRQARAGDVGIGVDGTGAIDLASGSVIDVSARRPGDRLVQIDRNGAPDYSLAAGDQGGQIHLRAPLIERTGPDAVRITAGGALRGAREVVVEGFKRFNLADTPGLGFVGVTLAGGQAILDPGAGGGVNILSSEAPGTIPSFVQNFDLGAISGLAGAHLRPGIELDYAGGITLATNWNLGAAVVDENRAVAAGVMHAVSGMPGRVAITAGQESILLSGLTNTQDPGGALPLGHMLYRVGGDIRKEGGELTLRAGGSLTLNGAITDGFFQFRDQRDPTYVNHALGGGDRTVLPALLPSCTTDDCADIPGFVSGALPTDYVYIPYPAFSEVSAGGWAVDPFLEAPYAAAANSASPTGLDPLGNMVLFPRLTDGAAAQAWSYRLTAGADLGGAGSVDPLRVLAGSTAGVQFGPETPYTVTPTRGTVAFADRFVLTTDGIGDEGAGVNGRETASASQWLAAFLAAHPDAQANDMTVIDFSTAPSRSLSTLGARARAFFTPLGSSNYQFVGNPNSPVAVYTSLSRAADFMAAQGGDFSSLARFYHAPNAPKLEAPLTAMVKEQVRTGSGSIAVAAAGDIDLRGGAAVTYRTAAGVKTTETKGFQIGGGAIYSAGVVADLSARTAVDSVTGARVLNPASSAVRTDVFANFAPAPVDFPRSIMANPVYATGGGDVTLTAGRDVLSRRAVWQETQTPAGVSWGGTGDQAWRVGSIGPITEARINPQLFTEGVGALAGGDLRVSAGRNVSDLSVVSTTSLVTASLVGGNGGKALVTLGGGDLTVTAGGDILGGRIDIASGRGVISAGGDVADAGAVRLTLGSGNTPVANSMRMRLADATVDLSAAGTVRLRGIGALGVRQGDQQPGRVQNNANAALFYSPTASVSILADDAVLVDNRAESRDLYGPAGISLNSVFYPGSVSVTSLGGDVNLGAGAPEILLAPTARGTLSVLSGGDISDVSLVMDDSDPGFLPGLFTSFRANDQGTVLAGRAPLFPAVLPDTPDVIRRGLHNRNLPHLGDTVPNRFYADGSISGVTLWTPKQARVGAGLDLVDMMFFGQNMGAEDITRITAGRDIVATSRSVGALINPVGNILGDPLPTLQGNSFVIGGPGSFFLEAGRDAGPFLNSAVTDGFKHVIGSGAVPRAGVQSYGGGILSVGSDWNPWLPDQGASIYTEFGVGRGQAFDAFRDAYIDPANLAQLNDSYFGAVVVEGGQKVRSNPIYGPVLIRWMQAHAADELRSRFGGVDVSYEEAYSAFKALPALQQRVFLVGQVYFNELAQPSLPTSPDFQRYARSFRAIDTLFPSALGYTRNDLTGASNGAQATVDTGNLDLRLSTIQTVRGGDIYILGPGGQVLAGSTVRSSEQAARRNYAGSLLYASDPGAFVAPIVRIPAGYEGVLTLRGGTINSFTDRDFRLNQSRLFTEGGGDVIMWSSNGDLNAGQGPRSSANFPPVVVRVDENAYARTDAGAATTGAGIGAFQTSPDQPAPSVSLLAPHGTVDAGDAGVRVAGNLFIAALNVANADALSVGGTTTGLAASAPINVGAQAGANAAATAAQQVAEQVARDQGQRTNPSVISVDVLGYVAAPQSDAEDARNDQ